MLSPHRMSKDNHEAIAQFNEHEVRVTCSCNAMWTHPSGVPISHIDDIFNSHVAYFTHESMKTS